MENNQEKGEEVEFKNRTELNIEIAALKEQNELLQQHNEALKKQQADMMERQKKMEIQINKLTKGQQEKKQKQTQKQTQ